MAWGHDSRHSAKSEAMQDCRSEVGGNCGEALRLRYACGALAIGDNNSYGTG